jgi:hypothetical protein
MKKRYLGILAVMMMISLNVAGQLEKAQSLYIYNFTKYIEWPKDMQQGDFVILVLGNSSLYDELSGLTTGKRVGNQSIVVKKISNPGQITKSNILFVGSSYCDKISNQKDLLLDSKTLVIGERRISGNTSFSISFFVDDSRLKFELNKTNLNSSGLQMDQKLALLASNK